MTQPVPPHQHPEFRLQGTDGIRREVRLASAKELRGMSPQQIFLERGFITEEFMELYAHAHVSNLMRLGQMKPGDAIVVGWDPRDVKGQYTGAVIRGVQKTGATALVIGIAPTPLAPTYMLYKNARGAFMITASHNPKDQNGVKIFSAFRGMKLLPDNDIELTRAVLSLDYKKLKKAPLTGKKIQCRKEALKIFSRFSLEPENTWNGLGNGDSVSFDNITLVVDPANGSLSGIAEEAFRKAGFGQVIEVNGKLNGDVNLWSGVADLEGHSSITPQMISKGSGIFQKHRAVLKLFQIGRKFKSQIQSGRRRVCGAVFDADGDRFYRLEYDPFQDCLLVLSGDETAFFQAEYLMTINPRQYKGTHYINTVESDLNTSLAAANMGFRPVLTAVGDKWILLHIVKQIVEERFKSIKKGSRRSLPSSLVKKIATIQKQGSLNVHGFQEIEKSLDRQSQQTTGSQHGPDSSTHVFLGIGSEETGHNITTGWLTCEDGKRIPVFLGNGLKSAINTFTATEFLFQGKSARTYFSRLRKPFPAGFKKTMYTYYIRQERFKNKSKVWGAVKKAILQNAKKLGYRGTVSTFPEDPHMLYIALKKGTRKNNTAGVFVRNSGTENKISVNLRGEKKDARNLTIIGEEAIRLLMSAMKDTDNHYYKLELDILSQVAGGPIIENRIVTEQRARTRLLAEMKKQNLIQQTVKGFQLTQRGQWYITSG